MNPNFLILIFLYSLAFGQSDSSLDTSCKKDGFSCGECETALQNDLNALIGRMTGGKFKHGDHWGDGKETTTNSSDVPLAPGVTLDNTLREIVGLFRKHNPTGDNKLNFVVIGESESLQGTSVRDGKVYPRVMLKSPNSELMVTFNTDPKAKGYNTIEIMRWNGKKGRYEFQELNFGDRGEPPHVDVSGSKCIECHKESPRPNWDTYRAWAGVVPSRDDMLEVHGENGSLVPSKGFQPDANAYLNFLEQIAEDKDSGKKSRIAMLDIPFDDKRQLGDYVKASGKNLSSKEKIEIIKKNIRDKGFYRIRHFPDKDEVREKNGKVAFNFDTKTADWAGPSQFAFDQMLAQNMCKVTTDLKKHKDFDKFKYGLALLMACGNDTKLGRVYPESFKEKILNYYGNTNYSSLQDIDPELKPKGRASSYDALVNLLEKDTSKSHENANGFKFNRHGKFLNSYLTGVEKLTSEEAMKKARYYSEEVVTPTLNKFHAIDDQGGVKGVPEKSTGIMSQARLLLEPFGVKVGHWSLVHGKSNAYNSFSFSDQFDLLKEQPLWKDIIAEAGSCRELENKTREKLESAKVQDAPVSIVNEDVSELAVICKQLNSESDPLTGVPMEALNEVMIKMLEPSMKKSLQKCLSCHDTNGQISFPGLSKFVKSGDEKEFTDFLNSRHDYFQRPVIEVLQIKLGLLPKPKGDSLDYGADMPPMDWSDNNSFAHDFGINPEKAQEERRKKLAVYLSMKASGESKERMRSLCGKINTDSYIKEFNGKAPKKMTSKASNQ